MRAHERSVHYSRLHKNGVGGVSKLDVSPVPSPTSCSSASLAGMFGTLEVVKIKAKTHGCFGSKYICF